MDYLKKLITEIELHSVDGIKECFENGVSPNDKFRNEPLIYELIGEYTRTSRFKNCVKTFVDYGLHFEEEALLAVLTDDAVSLQTLITEKSGIVAQTFNLRCAYTPFHQVTLLHICAEFNHLSCAEVLVRDGANINARAGTDEYGFGGQTPIFHTVNQNSNNSIDMLNYLLSKSADLHLTVPGLIWGKSYEWETLIPAVNPISYAMMGLLPQMHRNEVVISNIVSVLLKAAFGVEYSSPNVPNSYLR